MSGLDIFYRHFILRGDIGVGTTDIGGKSLGDLFDGNSRSFSLFGAFEWDVLNYGRLKNNIRLQDARFQQLLADYQNIVLRAQGEVENAVVAFLRSQEQVRYYANAAEAAQRAVALATLQYDEGAVDFQRVLSTTATLVQQQDVLAATQGVVATNLVQVYKSLGGGWDVANVDVAIPDEIKQQMLERTKYWDGVLE